MQNSAWSRYLKKETDAFSWYRDLVAYKTENLVADITNELLIKGEGYTSETAKSMAVNVVMEEMLAMQHQETPGTQKAMLVNLFAEHPDLKDFRYELLETMSAKFDNEKKKLKRNSFLAFSLILLLNGLFLYLK